MKKILKIFLSLIVLGIILIGALLFYINPILELVKPEIENAISKNINQQVNLGKLSLNLFPETVVEVAEVRLAGGEKAQLGKLLLKTNLSSLLEKKLEVTEVSIIEPNISIVKNVEGTIIVEGLNLAKNQDSSEQKVKTETSPTTSSLSFKIKNANVKNATFNFLDQTKTPPQQISLKNINLNLNDVSSTSINDLAFSASFLDTKDNLKLTGSVENYQFPFSFQVKLNLTSLNLVKLSEIVPELAAYNLKGDLIIEAESKKTVLQDLMKPEYQVVISLNNFGTSINKNGSAINLKDLNLKVQLKNEEFIFPAANIFEGTISADGKFAKNKLSAKVKAQNINIGQAIAAFGAKNSLNMQGKLSNLDLNIQGDSNNFATSNSGDISALFNSGEILGFNVLGDSLKKLFELPLLGAALTTMIPQEYLPIIQKNSTAFDEIKLEANFIANNINVRNLFLKHFLYSLTAEGKILANGNMNLNAKLILSELLMGKLLAKEPKLKLLTDKNNNIVIPLLIKKEGSSFIVLPDLADLGKRALNNTAKEAATKAVGKALDKVAPGLGSALDTLF